MRGSYRASVVGPSWFFLNLLAATMFLVVVARNGLLFLVCWEGMSLASFFLVLTDHEREPVQRAAWIYLAAMHLGTACLLVLFLLLGRSSGSLEFDRFACEPGSAGILFVLAVIGFGTKAGFIPVHVWLPEAHPAAPSHVSAVMSGVMIKTGIYGLLRTLTFLGDAPSWWGWTLVAVGVLSGTLGVLFALAQHDLKRLLAYHSVENIGIISLGLGVGLLGLAHRIPVMAFMGFDGAMLHVLNHALFKSLLFLGAGAVQHGTGTRDIDRLGGLLKKMPVTGATFLVGSCAISGLPPLNGFVSELLIYLGVLTGVADHDRVAGVGWALLCVVVVGGLALIGGLAAACFTKAFGCVFLGEPRSEHAARGHEVGAAMRAAMLLLAGACFVVALTGPIWPSVYRSSIVAIAPASFQDAGQAAAEQTRFPLIIVCASSWAFLAMVGLLAMVRRNLLSGRRVDRVPTWDCGYAVPTPRMQYTASSFASPLLLLFRMFLRPRISLHPPTDLFPKQASFESETPDVFRECLFQPAFTAIAWTASKLRWFQHGRIQLYVLYIALTILVLLIWKLG
jgi:formate hydrogenlyase subunit 3/multisubunit Na+/H+ antiporter MnhD subunit